MPADRPLLMGVLNFTPDSFSDGGTWQGIDQALSHALAMVESGADIVDVGGESTRPGAAQISIAEEMDRVLPIIERIRAEVDVPISIDTTKPELMLAAVDAGAGMINDVNALQAEGALEVALSLRVPVCLMHMQGQPRSMQQQPYYQDVVAKVSAFLLQRAAALVQAGFRSRDIVLDPGFGFGKTLQHNIELFQAIPRLAGLGYPLLVGVSRKSMLGAITGQPVGARVHASVAAAMLAAQNGASILRVHDVQATLDALKVWQALGLE
ncbi:MAG: dihydropteroate synthase [Xanthomonadales bacterium]|nr:dihydropteroate synthase [Xanthomonadales bacterium]